MQRRCLLDREISFDDDPKLPVVHVLRRLSQRPELGGAGGEEGGAGVKLWCSGSCAGGDEIESLSDLSREAAAQFLFVSNVFPISSRNLARDLARRPMLMRRRSSGIL